MNYLNFHSFQFFTALSDLLGGMHLSEANYGLNTTPESQQNVTWLQNMFSAAPTPGTMSLPNVIPNDPIDNPTNMLNNQSSLTPGKTKFLIKLTRSGPRVHMVDMICPG